MADWDVVGEEPADEWSVVREEPVSVKAGRGIREIPRQIGLTARYGMEAFGQTALPDLIGLPQPEGANERVIGDASRMLISAGGIAKGAQFLTKAASPLVSAIGSALEANTAGQAAGAVGAGLAGGSVREAGGGPGEQFAASLAGGLAAPLAARGAIRTAQSAGSAIRSAVAPKNIEGEVKIALERSGVNWADLSNEVRAKLVRDAQKTVALGEPLNPQALARLADYRNIGATPLKGDITQNPRDVTRQRNLSKTQANAPAFGGPDLPAIENQNARTVLSTLEGVEKSPLDTYATGARIQNTISSKDAALKTGESELYRSARDSQGRQIPLDRQAFVNSAFDNLAQNNRGPWLPAQVREVLNTLSKGEGQFTVDTIDQLKTLLAQESRAAANGNVKAAIASVRDALENAQPAISKPPTGSTLPITGQMASRLGARDAAAQGASEEALAAFDKARQAARGRRTWQESAKFIEDALEGTDPQAFAKKHVINGDLETLTKLRTELKNDPESVAAVRKQLLGYILERGKADSDTVKFTSAGMKSALDQLGDRKLRLFFTGDEIQKIKSAVNVARYSQSQPIGSAVNNSNTAAMAIGRIFESLVNAGTGVPVLGPMVAQPLRNATVSLQARSAASVPNALMLPGRPEPFPLAPLLPLLAIAPPSNQ
jgi:hypothetical protein